jgi:hypothetical protein
MTDEKSYRERLAEILETMLDDRRALLLKIGERGYAESDTFQDRLFRIQKIIDILELAIKREPSDFVGYVSV